MRRSHGCRAGGFTLLEALLAVVLVGIAASAFTAALTAGIAHSQASVRGIVATSLATGLMNEILSRPFRDPNTPGDYTPGPEAGETTRTLLDNVDDYDGHGEPIGQLRGPDGVVRNDATLIGYSRTAAVSYVRFPGQDPALPPAFAVVTVTVKYGGNPVVSLKRVISSEERR